MRVLLVSPAAEDVLRFRLPLVRALLARGDDVHLRCEDGPPSRTLRMLGVTIHPTPTTARDGRLARPAALWRDTAHLREVARDLQPDAAILHTHRLVAFGAPALRRAGVPRVVGVITGLGRGRAATDGLLGRVRRFAFDAAVRRGARACDVVAVLNADDAAEARRRRWADGDRLVVLPGEGVDATRFAPIPRDLPRPGAARFLFVGRLLASKGLPTLVQAAARLRQTHPDAIVRVIGGPDPGHPDALAPSDLARWRLSSGARFEGPVEDVREALADADVFVLPSVAEGLSMAAMEAMATGLPVITTDAPGGRDLLEDGVQGLLVPVGDAEALHDALAALADDPDTLARMGRAARARVEQRLASDVVVPQVLSLLDGP